MAWYQPPKGEAATTYAGKLDAGRGAQSVLDVENELGAGPVNFDEYIAAQRAGLRANVDEGITAERAIGSDQAASHGFINSGTARALERGTVGRGERTYALGDADITRGATAMTLEQNARRTGQAGDYAGMDIQNQQFGAQLGEGQRQYDNDASYGAYQDKYQVNVLDRQRRTDERKARQANVVGQGISSVLGAAGSIVGGALAGRKN